MLRRAYAYSRLGLDVGLVVAGTRAAPAPWTEFALLFPCAAGVDPRALTIGLAGPRLSLGCRSAATHQSSASTQELGGARQYTLAADV